MEHNRSAREPQLSLSGCVEAYAAELYRLSFLLTGDRNQSAEALTRTFAVEDSPNPVFRGFMLSWARKLAIVQALAAIDTELRESMIRSQEPGPAASQFLPSPKWILDRSVTSDEFHRAVLALDVFPRCALLLTIFERLSVTDTALLLNAEADVVKRAQARALVELTRNIALGRGWVPARASSNMGPIAEPQSAMI